MTRSLRAVTVTLILFLSAAPAWAHPLGNFTVNRFSGLEIAPDEIVVRYAVDMAEIPTFQESGSLDSDRDGSVSEEELTAYADDKADLLLDGVRLSVDAAPLSLSIRDARASLRPGQGGLDVLRLDVTFAAPLRDAAVVIEYLDVNFVSLQGWKEVIAYGVRGERVVDANVPRESISDALHAYPKKLLQDPPDIRWARVDVAPGPEADRAVPTEEGEVTSRREIFGDAFASLIERDISPLSVVVACLLALAFGAWHALLPGHGKTVMAAYLVGAEGKVRHAVAIGVAVSLMHTASVIVLGLTTLWLASLFPPEAVYPWLALASGIVVLGLGTWLFRVRWRLRRARTVHETHHHHDVTEEEHRRAHALGLDHDHPAPAGASPFSRKGLVAIAVSGGLLPSPTALVVLLGAVALHRIPFGIALVGAFSIGLAAALTIIGIIVIRARTFAQRRFGIGVNSVLPLLSSVAIIVVGTVLTVRAAITLSG